MAKIKVIHKSRKEYRCSKCSKVIPIGSKYYKGEINFGPTIIRCADCGLKSYEVTTSDWVMNVGQLLDNWSSEYTICEDGVNDIISAIEEIRDDQQDRLDQMPEQLQDSSSAGELLNERIDACESAISDLESIDYEDLKNSALSTFLNNHENDSDNEIINKITCNRYESEADIDYDELVQDLIEACRNDLADEIESEFTEALNEVISEALCNNLEI